MKNLKYIFICLVTMALLPFNVLGAECESVLGSLYEDLRFVYKAIQISTPILVVILIMKDMIIAVTAGKADDMKKAQQNAIKRIIVGVIIFLVPYIVDYILYLIGQNSCPIWR